MLPLGARPLQAMQVGALEGVLGWDPGQPCLQHKVQATFQKRCQAGSGCRWRGQRSLFLTATISRRPPRCNPQMVTQSMCRAPCALDVPAPELETQHGCRVGKQALAEPKCRLCPQIQNRQWRWSQHVKGNVTAKEHKAVWRMCAVVEASLT